MFYLDADYPQCLENCVFYANEGFVYKSTSKLLEGKLFGKNGPLNTDSELTR